MGWGVSVRVLLGGGVTGSEVEMGGRGGRGGGGLIYSQNVRVLIMKY